MPPTFSSASEIYSKGFATTVSVGRVREAPCGDSRPSHFDGVATVVTKLFLKPGADRASFGEKDFQQLRVVGRLARGLDIPIAIVACPTVREEDGLAMSSRNLHLSPAQHRAAPRPDVPSCRPAMGKSNISNCAPTMTFHRSTLPTHRCVCSWPQGLRDVSRPKR